MSEQPGNRQDRACAQLSAASPRTASNLTRMQHLIWAGQRIAGAVPLYNMIHTFDLRGHLDREALAHAFARLVAQSDALRAIVVEEPAGTPQMRVAPAGDFELPCVDFSAAGAPQQDARHWMEARLEHVFVLDRSLIDAALLRVAADHHIVYLNLHHLITDGGTSAVLFERLSELYGAYLGGGPATGLDYPQFRDYQKIEAAVRDDDRGQTARRFWEAQRAGPWAPLAFYGRRVPGSAYRTHRLTYRLGADFSQALRARAVEPGIRAVTADLSLYGVFLALVQVLTFRITGVGQFLLGSPFHNRSTPAARKTVGALLEIGVLRCETCPTDSFADLVRKAHEQLLGAMRHVRPGITTAETNGSFSVLLNFVRDRIVALEGVAVRTDWLHSGFGDAGHAMRVQVVDFDGEDSFAVHFDLAEVVFPAETRNWVLGHFERVLVNFLSAPEQPVGSFSLLDAQQRTALVEAFNATESARDPDRTVPALILARCEAQPKSIALRTPSGGPGPCPSLTYAELALQARHLASHLMGLGVEPGDRVAILLDRRLETPVVCLAVNLAGAAYVPLDPTYPDARLHTVMGDANLRAIVTTITLAHRVPDGPWLTVLVDQLNLASGRSLDAPRCTPDGVAYIMYTSGSTGIPKGVVVSHRNLADYVTWAADQYCDGEALSFALCSSLAFDLTVTALFVPLISGGSLRIYPEREATPGMAVLDVFRENAVEVLKLTPSHLALALETDYLPTRLRRLILGGEDLRRDLAERALARMNGRVEILNEYGPTEATVGCMVHRFDPESDPEGSVPIGKPAADTRIYVLDHCGQPAPPGMAGELCVASRGVAGGYLGRPEETASVFCENPFHPGEKLYRTGDLACWTESGQLRFLGRSDDQVKVRGVRVELGEVESQLGQHPDLLSVAVRLIDRNQGASLEGALRHCVRCGMSSRYPGLGFDTQGVCSICGDYERYRDKVSAYFRSTEELEQLLKAAPRSPEGYHCMMLLSGGKDSTYALCRLVDMGLDVLAYTLDNGYLSEQAKDNIRRVTGELGVDLEFGSTPHMNAIFTDSLERFSNVCNGCFKTIYTLSTSVAHARGIRNIVTGLARGQMFETRLSDFYNADVYDAATIDARILEARKAYHRMDDLIARILDVELFRDDAVFDEIRFVDFYRYCEVTLDEMLDYLRQRVPWIRPTDTGRSTNCLINDVGIFVHRKERGFHNYSLPYSWDVRLGHKTREEALEELDDEIDEVRVTRILEDVGYQPGETSADAGGDVLVAYYTASVDPGSDALRGYCRSRLPTFAVPGAFRRVDTMPLTPNGKIDRDALPWPLTPAAAAGTEGTLPEGPVLDKLLDAWHAVFHNESLGPFDNFFDSGGDSIICIQLVAEAARRGVIITPAQVFELQNAAGLAANATLAETAGHPNGGAERRAATIDIGIDDAELNALLDEFRDGQ